MGGWRDERMDKVLPFQSYVMLSYGSTTYLLCGPHHII